MNRQHSSDEASNEFASKPVRSPARWGLLAILVLLLASPWLSHAQSQTTVVSVADTEAVVGRTAKVNVSVEGAPSPGLSNFEGRLRYDPEVVHIQSVNGRNNYNIAAFTTDNQEGEVRFIGFKVSGDLVRNDEFLQFDALAVGDVNDSTTLRLSLRTFNLPNGDSISYSIDNGTFAITPETPLEADFTFEPSSPDVGQQVSFTDQSSGGGAIDSRSWDFGDGTSSRSTNPTHAYDSAGTYTVELTIEDDQGATDTASKQIVVGGGGTITFPIRNYPNPASTQTTFVYDLPAGTNDATLYVFDLRGRPIHETSLNTNQTEYDWNLSDVPEGAYYYRATATLSSGSGISNVGKLVIQR